MLCPIIKIVTDDFIYFIIIIIIIIRERERERENDGTLNRILKL